MAEKIKPELVTVADRVEPQINRFYQRKSRKYLVAGIAAMILLLLYIAGVTVFYGEYLTYGNLKYLMKDFDAMSVTGNLSSTRIVYNGTDRTEFKLFRKGLAVCDSDSYSYYDTSGVLLTEETLGYSSPVMNVSDKYLMIYNIGGTEYCIFNQLTQIVERDAEKEIIAACVSTDGSYAIASKSNETRYVVDLYNGAYNKVMSVYKEDYVTALAISSDGKSLLICEARPADSDFNCEIEIVKRGKSEPVAEIEYLNSMPLNAFATEKGFVVLTSTDIIFINLKGEVENTMNFSGMSLKYADVNSTSAVVVGSTNALGSENRVIVFDTANLFGTVTTDIKIKTRVMGAYASYNLSEALCYLKLPNSVAYLARDGSLTTESIENGEVLSVVPMNSGVLVCQKTSAYSAFINNKNGEEE